MPTKDELEKQNADLLARVAELEGGATPGVDTETHAAVVAELEQLKAERAAAAEAPAEQAAPEGNGPEDMCSEHFPQGFASDIVKWIEERTGPQAEVSCEHGTYRRKR